MLEIFALPISTPSSNSEHLNYFNFNDLNLLSQLTKLANIFWKDLKYENLKKNYDEVLSVDYDTIVVFKFYDQFGDIWKPDSSCMSINFKFLLIETF